MEVWATKVTALFLMLGISLMLGLAPVWFISRRSTFLSKSALKNKSGFWRVMSYLNCAVGGVFLGTTMLHLIPEVREQVQDFLDSSSIQTPFAVSEFLISMGFFLVMLIEHVVMSLQHHHNDVPLLQTSSGRPTASSSSPTSAHTHSHTHKDYGSLLDAHTSHAKPEKDVERSPLLAEGNIRNTAITSSTEHFRTSADPKIYKEADCVHIIHPSHHEHHHIQEDQLAGVRSFILLLAMSLHTVFEGLAIGLQASARDTWNLFIAIMAHKAVISFSLGVQFTGNLGHTKRAVLFVILFGLMSPLGIAVGTTATELSSQGGESGSLVSQAANALLQALATGTFIYVAFFEVLAKEVAQDHGVLKVVAVLLGFALMALLNLFNAEPDHH